MCSGKRFVPTPVPELDFFPVNPGGSQRGGSSQCPGEAGVTQIPRASTYQGKLCITPLIIQIRVILQYIHFYLYPLIMVIIVIMVTYSGPTYEGRKLL